MTDQIADGFIVLIGAGSACSPPRFARSAWGSRLSLVGIAAVGFDAVGSLFGNERGSDEVAMDAFVAQVAAQDETGGAGFIDEAQFDAGAGEFLDEFVHRVEGTANDAVAADFGGTCGGDADGDGLERRGKPRKEFDRREKAAG